MFSKSFLPNPQKNQFGPGRPFQKFSLWPVSPRIAFLHVQPVLGLIENVSVCPENLRRRFSTSVRRKEMHHFNVLTFLTNHTAASPSLWAFPSE
jgi:hypothetical protein